jgi:hypothetical protein
MTQDIEIFANYSAYMRSIFLHTRELFETCSADDRARMNATAATFFNDLNRVLNEYIILQVCKITDPAQDSRDNDNHTIEFLLQHYDFSLDPTTLNRLNELRAAASRPAGHPPVEIVTPEGPRSRPALIPVILVMCLLNEIFEFRSWPLTLIPLPDF